jgi:long-subunit fatty acid transport protein
VAPDVVSVGVQATPFPTTTFSLDLGLALWSLTWGRPGWVPGAGLARASGVGRLEDGVGLRAGVEQALPWVALDVVLRGGLLVEKSPVPVRATRGDQPWGDRVGGSAGAGWRLFGLTLDAAYVGDVTVPRAGAPGGDAQFWSTTHMAVVSVGYRYAR